MMFVVIIEPGVANTVALVPTARTMPRTKTHLSFRSIFRFLSKHMMPIRCSAALEVSGISSALPPLPQSARQSHAAADSDGIGESLRHDLDAIEDLLKLGAVPRGSFRKI